MAGRDRVCGEENMGVGGVQPRRSQIWQGRGVNHGSSRPCMEDEGAGLIKGRDPRGERGLD